jgi:hypothetical protein
MAGIMVDTDPFSLTPRLQPGDNDGHQSGPTVSTVLLVIVRTVPRTFERSINTVLKPGVNEKDQYYCSGVCITEVL